MSIDPAHNSPFSHHNGKGPTILGKIYSVIVTLREMVKKRFTSKDANIMDKPGTELTGSTLQQVLSEQLGSVSFIHFKLFEGISKKNSVEEVVHFFGEPPLNSEKPHFIPIILKGQGIIEKNHIVGMVVHGNTIEYYDPKGLTSDHIKLEKGTLRDAINEYNEKYFEGKAIIKENKTTHQFDCYNCGAYMLNYLFQRFKSNMQFDDFTQKDWDHRYIVEFRHKHKTE